jgi:hypothetical protein
MNEKCSVCGLAARAALESQLAAGVSLRALARQYHLGRDTIAHHKATHMTMAPKVALAPPAVVPSSAATPAPTPVRTTPDERDICRHCFKKYPWHIGWNGAWTHGCGHEWKPVDS